ncbi:MAG: high-affinity branched-chain amino acid ABC transporter permease LivM [Alphaproteobacteria bacterium]|nr:high-affinity branched-chain amino acid ABC transporter permease LivM [Alphaproteobacteria bacterium]
MAVQALAATHPGTFPAIVKEAALASLVAFVLALPLVGLQTVDSGGGALGITTHFDRVAYGVVAIFLGRLALAYRRTRRQERPAAVERPGAITRLSELSARFSLPIALLGIALAIGLPFMPFASRYIVDLGTTVLIYVMLGWGLNIVVGLAGLLDLGYVAFYAVGAYSFGLLASTLGFGFWEALPLSGLFAASFGVILGFPVLRLRGDYLAIVTLGFGEIIRIVLTNWSDVTNGPNGIGNIPRPTFFGLPFERNAPHDGMTFSKFFGIDFSPDHRVWALYFIILLLALLTNFFTLRIRRLPVGRAWEALREDEIACRALGINATNVKLSAFAIGAMFGGFAGCFFGARQGFISPESFNFIQSAIILAIVVLGGMGSQTGVVLAALVLVCLPELGRDLADFRMLAFGAAMVGIMVWRPRGLLAHREPSLRLHKRGAAPPGAGAGAAG